MRWKRSPVLRFDSFFFNFFVFIRLIHLNFEGYFLVTIAFLSLKTFSLKFYWISEWIIDYCRQGWLEKFGIKEKVEKLRTSDQRTNFNRTHHNKEKPSIQFTGHVSKNQIAFKWNFNLGLWLRSVGVKIVESWPPQLSQISINMCNSFINLITSSKNVVDHRPHVQSRSVASLRAPLFNLYDTVTRRGFL